MKCPECGEEIDAVEERGNNLVAYYAVWREVEPGVFEFFEQITDDVIDSQTDSVVCPKCEEALSYRIEEGRIVIESE